MSDPNSQSLFYQSINNLTVFQRPSAGFIHLPIPPFPLNSDDDDGVGAKHPGQASEGSPDPIPGFAEGLGHDSSLVGSMHFVETSTDFAFFVFAELVIILVKGGGECDVF